MQALTLPWRLRARQVLFTFINTLFPPICAVCQQPGALFCASCQNHIEWLHNNAICHQCGIPLTTHGKNCRHSIAPLQHIRAATLFTSPLPKLVHQLKYKGRFGLANSLATLLVQAWPHHISVVDLVIAIPLHPQKEKERGYNQSALLAQHFCQALNLNYSECALQRVRHTNPQVNLNAVDRRKNVQGAFVAETKIVANKHILLIDDVCTTGATLSEAANALLAAHAQSVSGYCLARAV